jgi:hypothetical protein
MPYQSRRGNNGLSGHPGQFEKILEMVYSFNARSTNLTNCGLLNFLHFSQTARGKGREKNSPTSRNSKSRSPAYPAASAFPGLAKLPFPGNFFSA